MRPLHPQSWWTICCREPFHGAATRSRDSLPMCHLSSTRVPSVRKQHCFISFAILFHMFPLVIYCLLHKWNHRVTGYEFCNRVEPKLEPKPITTSTREGPTQFAMYLLQTPQVPLTSDKFDHGGCISNSGGWDGSLCMPVMVIVAAGVPLADGLRLPKSQAGLSIQTDAGASVFGFLRLNTTVRIIIKHI